MGKGENRRRRGKSENKKKSPPEIGADAVVKLIDSSKCEKYGEVFFNPMTLQVETQMGFEALKYYRKDVLRGKLAGLEVKLEAEMINKAQFDAEFLTAQDEILDITIEDMPPMSIEISGPKGPSQSKTVDYTTWFMAATRDGQVTAVFFCKKDRPDITRDGLMEVYEMEPEFFIIAAQAIQDISKSRIAKK